MTTGDIATHLEDIYGTDDSRDTVSAVTARLADDMKAWQTRPLDRIYPVVIIDAIMLKIREGTVANRPVYVAMGVTLDGFRDVLGMWMGPAGGEGTKQVDGDADRTAEPGHSGCMHRVLRRPQRAPGRDCCGFDGGGGVDATQLAGDRLPVLPGGIPQAGSGQVHNASLHDRLRPDGVEPAQPDRPDRRLEEHPQRPLTGLRGPPRPQLSHAPYTKNPTDPIPVR